MVYDKSRAPPQRIFCMWELWIDLSTRILPLMGMPISTRFVVLEFCIPIRYDVIVGDTTHSKNK